MQLDRVNTRFKHEEVFEWGLAQVANTNAVTFLSPLTF